MSNHLNRDKKLRAIEMISEGMGVRSVVRVLKCHNVTVMALRDRASRACQRIIADKFRRLPMPFLQVDELWTFIRRKRAYCQNATEGRVWIYVALDPQTKLCPAFHIGQRTADSAHAFMGKLTAILSRDTQISTDRLNAYVTAIERTNHLGFWSREDASYLAHNRSFGTDGIGRTQTNHVETHNGQLRNHVAPLRRSSRLFSKTREGLEEHLWIYFFHYNFIKIHGSLGVTPAMRSGIATEPWSWMRLLKSAQEPGFARQPKQKRAPYGPRKPAQPLAA